MTTDEQQANPDVPPWRGPLPELERLQAEIDDDLTHGRITADEYDAARQRIEHTLKVLTAPPSPPESKRKGKPIRVVGIPAKKIDTELYAMTLFLAGQRAVREKRAREKRELSE
jgi:YD repeat-containing protein